MPVSNPYLPTLVDNREMILNKMKYVVQTYLAEAIAAYNTKYNLTGSLQLQYPRTINYNVNSMDLSNGTDQFPAVTMLVGSSSNEVDDFRGAQTDILDIDIISSQLCDAADINFNVQLSQALSLILCDLLEKHLPSAPSVNGTAIYRCDTLRTTSGRPQQFNNGLWLLSYSSTIRLYSRAQSNYDPTYINSDIHVPASVASSYYYTGTATWLAGSIDVGAAELNSMASITVPSGAASYQLSFTGTNIEENSTVTYSIQRDKKIVDVGTVPFTGGDALITLVPDTTPETNDVWTVNVTVANNQHYLVFPARLTVV